MNGLRFILMLLLAIKPVSANEQLSETVADVLELKGSGGAAGEPRRHELQVGSKLFTDKLVMLDRGAVMVVRYATDRAIYEFRGPSLIVLYRTGPVVVEGEAVIKRASD